MTDLSQGSLAQRMPYNHPTKGDPVVTLPFSEFPHFTQEVELDGGAYRLAFLWSERAQRWTMSVFSPTETPLAQGIPLALGQEHFRQYPTRGLPPGELWAVDLTGSLEKIGRHDLATGKAALVYIPEAESNPEAQRPPVPPAHEYVPPIPAVNASFEVTVQTGEGYAGASAVRAAVEGTRAAAKALSVINLSFVRSAVLAVPGVEEAAVLVTIQYPPSGHSDSDVKIPIGAQLFYLRVDVIED